MTQGRITEDQARELWRRAAELQATEQQHSERVLPVERTSGGLSLEQVAIAAEGAGIDPDFVRVALAEKQLPDSDRIDQNLWSARWLRRLLRQPDVLDVQRIVAAAPAGVLDALRSVGAKPTFEMMHEETIGEDPVLDGVLVYRIVSANTDYHRDLNFADVRVLLFRIRAHEGGTRLHVRAPLFRRGVNLAITGGAAGLTGWLGAGLGGALPVLAGSAALAFAPVALGATAGAVAGVAAYRKLYRGFYDGGAGALKRLVQAVAVEAEAGA
ncbi:MAG TPA: hypothetical protein VFZ04_01430 [Longimicrobiales bacterium]